MFTINLAQNSRDFRIYIVDVEFFFDLDRQTNYRSKCNVLKDNSKFSERKFERKIS